MPLQYTTKPHKKEGAICENRPFLMPCFLYAVINR